MFDTVKPFDGPVVVGLEQFETVYAKNQPQYIPLRTLPGRNGDSAIARFHFTDAQRKAISEGADIYLELLHFGGRLAPSVIMVMSEPPDTDNFRLWWKAQTNAPYRVNIAAKQESADAGEIRNGRGSEETAGYAGRDGDDRGDQAGGSESTGAGALPGAVAAAAGPDGSAA